MGNCASGNAPMNEEERAKNREIEKELQQQKKVIEQELKILLLGAGDTGKSTLIKQIKLIYKAGFTEDEREIFRDVIATNILVWMHTLISAVKKLDLKWGKAENRDAADRILNEIADQSLPSLEERFSILVRHRDVFLSLWTDSAIQEAFSQANSFQLGESSKFFFENVSRIAAKEYVPTDEDILLARARTTGVVETTFQTDGRFFRILDVGGQRSERRKWIHCFEEVTTIIFFAALSEYNLALYEERGVNRMKESLKLFQEIVNCVWFKDTSVVLFLNKSDLFREKLAKYPLSEVFPEYTGGSNFQAGCDFVQKMYMSLNSSDTRPIYPHITCCTDTNQIRKVLDAVKDVFLRAAISTAFTM